MDIASYVDGNTPSINANNILLQVIFSLEKATNTLFN